MKSHGHYISKDMTHITLLIKQKSSNLQGMITSNILLCNREFKFKHDNQKLKELKESIYDGSTRQGMTYKFKLIFLPLLASLISQAKVRKNDSFLQNSLIYSCFFLLNYMNVIQITFQS